MKRFSSLVGAAFLALAPTIFAGPADPVTATVRLDEIEEGEHFWGSSNGQEFKGAKVALTAVPDDGAPGQMCLKLVGDFTGGGVYVAAMKNLKEFGFSDLSEVVLRVKAENTDNFGVQMTDGTGQVHQRKGLPVVSDGQWHEISLKPSEIAGGEHWGGANDGKWHGAPTAIVLTISKPKGENKVATVHLADIRAKGTVIARTGKPVFDAVFDAEAIKGWKTTGNVAVSDETFKGPHSLALVLPADNVNQPTAAQGPSFSVPPGPLEVKVAAKSAIDSQDNSYCGTVNIDFLDGSGKEVGTDLVLEMFRQNPWKSVTKRVEVPQNANAARFSARINKQTPGTFWVGELSAAPVAPEQKDTRVQSLVFTSAQVGNLLYPEDARTFTVTVLASRPLPENLRTISATVRDYWGADYSERLTAKLEKKNKKDNLFVYEGALDLSKVPVEVGRYYELHGEIPRQDSEPFRNYTSFAILPEAPANSYKPEEIPFTSRAWDNRVGDFIRLTRRLGIRICGAWASWKPAPPYTAKLAQADLITQLGMGALTTTPALTIEARGKDWEKWDETALRQSIRNLLQAHATAPSPLVINLGNEPHSKGDAIKTDIDAYRIIYSEVKSVNPNILVVGTSLGPNEDYFKAGIGEYCDAYDFHVYESADDVRRILEVDYPALFKKYGNKKPIWSTEMGLNSQGMTRQIVAGEVYKKIANFFAGGGANISWFSLLYPDAKGTMGDSSGSAHNVFDSRFNKYAPKLDAIAYYNTVNGLAVKKYADDKVYGDDLHAFLFRDKDNRAMQILYKTKGREDVFLPLPGAGEVEITHIDGRITKLQAAPGGGITLTVSGDPIMLQYASPAGKLPETLGVPAISLASGPASFVRGDPTTFEVAHAGGKVELSAPPSLAVEKKDGKGAEGSDLASFTATIPEESTMREADFVATMIDAKGLRVGEIGYRPAATGAIATSMLPVPAGPSGAPAVRLLFQNNTSLPQVMNWEIALDGERAIQGGNFQPPAATMAAFAGPSSGTVTLEPRGTAEATVPLTGIDPLKIYLLAATTKDAKGRTLSAVRPMGGFVGVPKLKNPPAAKGMPAASEWDAAPAQIVDQPSAYFPILKKLSPSMDSPADLSAKLRFLWDETYLYMRADVTDDIAGKPKPSNELWNQDGLQIIVDPFRKSDQKPGKYDYAFGVGEDGPAAWCHLSGDPTIGTGLAKDIAVNAERKDPARGDTTYVIAIPWSSLKPFAPAPGANLGLAVALNEDDGNGRDSYLSWFGNAQTKDVSENADLILQE